MWKSQKKASKRMIKKITPSIMISAPLPTSELRRQFCSDKLIETKLIKLFLLLPLSHSTIIGTNHFCSFVCLDALKEKTKQLKALVVKNSVLHNFGFGKVSQIHETFLMELQLFGWRHFSKTKVVQNTVLNH